MKGDGRVGIGGGVEDEDRAFAAGFLHPGDELAFGIGLAQHKRRILRQRAQPGVNIFQGVPAVNLGLARAEQIEIWATEDIYRFRHGSPFALDSHVLQEGNRSETAMKITLNGETLEIAGGTTVAMLVEQLAEQAGRDPRGVAVERNLEIVPKSEHALTTLAEGDRIELVQFVGGG